MTRGPSSPWLAEGPSDAALTLLFAHGAGAPMDTPFMDALAGAIAQGGLRVLRFEFAYMAARREGGPKRPPPAIEKVAEEFAERAGQTGGGAIALAGKSMGARAACLAAARLTGPARPLGVVAFGYPFHPPGKPDRLRLDPIGQCPVPMLICQGTRDPFGGAEEVAGYELPPRARLHWLADGDHDLKPRRRSGRTAEQNWDEAAAAAGGFLKELGARNRRSASA